MNAIGRVVVGAGVCMLMCLSAIPLADAQPRAVAAAAGESYALVALECSRGLLVEGIVERWRASLQATYGPEARPREWQLREALWGVRAERLRSAWQAVTLEGLADALEGGAEEAAQPRAKADRAVDCGSVLPKDGPGAGPNSWIGYTSGSNQATGSGSAVAAGTFNLASGQGAFVGAGTANQANGISALVIGGFDNRAVAIDSVVIGGAGNRATGARSVVVSGGYNWASGQWSAIVGGGRDGTASTPAGTDLLDNVAAGDYSFIGGGQGNRTTAAADWGTVGGGYGNTASGFTSTIGGGQFNTASGSTVGGGSYNTASGSGSTIGGGTYNTASGIPSSVGGGQFNTASGIYGTVAGGYSNTASGIGSTVGGGETNTASGDWSTVGGGYNNIAGGFYSTIGGGINNTASGTYSVAAGVRAKATHLRSFVWGGSDTADTFSQADGDFVVYAPGGIKLYPAAGGCTLTNGSSGWSCSSDRSLKTAIVPIDAQAVLARVVGLPIARWSFAAAPGIAHMGPMAQDFHAAFGLGDDATRLAPMDVQGVALAAIQGLNAKLEAAIAERDSRLAAQERELLSERAAREAQARKLESHHAEIAEMRLAHERELVELRRAVEVLLARTAASGAVAGLH